MLLIVDEVQSGLGRTGRWFAFEHEGIRPDALILGKALGGGLLPVSAFLADDRVMDVFEPGSHGSTFGGNALAAAVALEALQVIEDEHLVARSAALGEYLLARLRDVMRAPARPLIREVRGRGLWVGVDIDPAPRHGARAGRAAGRARRAVQGNARDGDPLRAAADDHAGADRPRSGGLPPSGPRQAQRAGPRRAAPRHAGASLRPWPSRRR